MPLAPEYEAMFAELAKTPAPPLAEQPPEVAREMYRMMRPVNPELPCAGTDQTVPGPGGPIPVRIYNQQADQPIYINFHGGGWVIGDLDTSDAACRDIASQLACTVVSVDYRLAPEHRFPAAVEDCYAVVEWAAENRASLGGGPIIVGGESAGGNLAAVVSQLARDTAGPEIALQVLWYPVVDHDLERPSYERNGEGYLLELQTMHWFWDHYCPQDARKDPQACPLLADDLANLPPAIVVTAEFDPLIDEGKAYADALTEAGGSVTYHSFDGLVHDFCATAGVLTCSRQAVDTVYQSIRTSLAK